MKNTCFFVNTSFRCIFLVLALMCVKETAAQLHLKANMQNMHLWRGMEVTDGLVFITDLSVTDKNEHFTLGLWAGTNVNGTYKEFNHYISYARHGLKFALWDTYNFSPNASYNNKEYFNYKLDETGRFIDATISYDFERFLPLKLSWSTILYGRDRDKQNTKNLYSTFVYGEYSVYDNEYWNVNFSIGVAWALNPDKSQSDSEKSYHFYGEAPGVVHLSLNVIYKLRILERDFPVSIMPLWNPQNNKGYFQVGVQLFSF